MKYAIGFAVGFIMVWVGAVVIYFILAYKAWEDS